MSGWVGARSRISFLVWICWSRASGTSPFYIRVGFLVIRLVMIRLACKDCSGAVELFKKNHVRHLVRECHRRE